MDETAVRWTWIFKWALSVALLALVLWYVPLEEIGKELGHAKPGWNQWRCNLGENPLCR